MCDFYTYPGLTRIISFLFFIVWHLILTTVEKGEIEEYYSGGFGDYEGNVVLIERSDGRGRGVIDINTAAFIQENYFKKSDNMYIKIAPDRIEKVNGSFLWRFFKAGVIKGDSVTSFTNKYWWKPKDTKYIWRPTPYKPKPTFLGTIRFDPSNPTPFWITVLISFIAFNYRK